MKCCEIVTIFTICFFILQIINKLTGYLDAEKGKEYYNAILNKYGLYTASKMLLCCDAEFILTCLRTYRVEITSRQLLQMVQKYPDYAQHFLAALNRYQAVKPFASKYQLVFTYIAKRDLKLYLKLVCKYDLSDEHLGWRATARTIKTNKQVVIEEDGKICHLLHRKQTIKSLRGEFVDFYANKFPKRMSNFDWSRLGGMISSVRSNAQKAALVSRAFEKAYGCPILDYPQLVSLELLELLPAEMRDNFVKTTSEQNHAIHIRLYE